MESAPHKDGAMPKRVAWTERTTHHQRQPLRPLSRCDVGGGYAVPHHIQEFMAEWHRLDLNPAFKAPVWSRICGALFLLVVPAGCIAYAREGGHVAFYFLSVASVVTIVAFLDFFEKREAKKLGLRVSGAKLDHARRLTNARALLGWMVDWGEPEVIADALYDYAREQANSTEPNWWQWAKWIGNVLWLPTALVIGAWLSKAETRVLTSLMPPVFSFLDLIVAAAVLIYPHARERDQASWRGRWADMAATLRLVVLEVKLVSASSLEPRVETLHSTQG